MDIFIHGLVGTAIGYKFEQPVTGLLFGILPDFVLGIRRKPHPNTLYRITHSFLFALLFILFPVAFLSLLSHIFIDIFTHCEEWSPRIVYPHDFHVKIFSEWEYFNKSYILGLFLSLIIILLLSL